MTEFMGFVKDFGFPVAVTAFVLIRLEMRMKELTKALTDLGDKIERQL